MLWAGLRFAVQYLLLVALVVLSADSLLIVGKVKRPGWLLLDLGC